jgi:DNA-binding XRE family transcriptional regulator
VKKGENGMETTKTLLDAVKEAKGITSDYALAKTLELPKQRISGYYKGKEAPNEFVCLQIAKALGRSYEEVTAIVRIEAEKDENRRQVWQEYYKNIGGYAASIAIILATLPETIITTMCDYVG